MFRGSIHAPEIFDGYRLPCDVMVSQQWHPLFQTEHKTLQTLVGARGFLLPKIAPGIVGGLHGCEMQRST